MNSLKRIEKIVTEGMLFLSALLLAFIVSLFIFEIFVRYILNSPTKWSNDLIIFLMPAMVFLSLPEITRRNQHISITFLVDSFKPKTFKIWQKLISFISSIISMFAGWIMISIIIKQHSANILTNTVVQAPKWLIMTPIAISFIAISIVFLITALDGREK